MYNTQICLACAHASMAAGNIICCAACVLCLVHGRACIFFRVIRPSAFRFSFFFASILLYPLRARVLLLRSHFLTSSNNFFIFSLLIFHGFIWRTELLFFLFSFPVQTLYITCGVYSFRHTHPIDKLPRFALEAFQRCVYRENRPPKKQQMMIIPVKNVDSHNLNSFTDIMATCLKKNYFKFPAKIKIKK